MIARNRHGMTLWEGVCPVREKRHHLAYAGIDRRTTINSMPPRPLRALCEKKDIPYAEAPLYCVSDQRQTMRNRPRNPSATTACTPTVARSTRAVMTSAGTVTAKAIGTM